MKSVPPRRADTVHVAVVSAAVLAYEVLLTRMLGVHYWSSFAGMIVSLAMLGFAASGTALFLVARQPARLGGAVTWMTVCFAVALPLCPRLSEHIHCMPLTVLWDPRQLALFAAHYLILSLPFFFGGFIIGAAFVSGVAAPGRVYFASLLGSGAGVLIALLVLGGVHPQRALCLLVPPVAVAGWVRERRARPRAALAGVLALLPLGFLHVPALPVISEYKGLSGLMLMPDARIVHQGWNRFGHLAVVDSTTIRYAPGLTLTYAGSLPAQKAVFTNGDDMDVVCAGARTESLPAFFGSMLSGLAYRFHEQPRVLVLGAGGGMDVQGALALGAAHVDAVERNTAIVGLMRGMLRDYSANLYGRPDVRLVVASARAFAASHAGRYDVISVSGKRSLFASAAGTASQDPDYLLTVEALDDWLACLAPGGVLAIETWLSLPPRHSAKLFATAATALRTRGLDPRQHLVAVRSLQTGLLLVFRDPVTPSRAATVASFCESGSFDRVYDPAITPEAANRFNRLDEPAYFALDEALLRDPEDAYRGHLFQIRPATDDRPYFPDFFRWRALPQLAARSGQNLAVHVGWGTMFLLITLAQAVPLGALLILVPLAGLRGGRSATPDYRRRAFGYFAALGVGFMFLEVAAIQQMARFLPHPVYAFGVTIGIILVAAGVGARASEHRAVSHGRLFGAVMALMLVHVVVWQGAIRWRSTALFGVDIAILALLAFVMGMPFPRGIERLRRHAPALVPWAWGINGYASVLAALAAGMIALAWGLSALVLAAAVAYAVAAAAGVRSRDFPGVSGEPRLARRSPSTSLYSRMM